ncbi:hypothetical protein LCGC14_2115900 [marine sediment metagenome]|uniref:Uncharacterized protein n=1 Tax=marine sediment metagenome TaxID=412755 RepID=A0A0F9E5S9_9ZZZZ
MSKTDEPTEEGMATHEQSDLIEEPVVETSRWRVSLDEIDTHQARAQIEALRAIAEELHELNGTLDHIDTLLVQKG